MVNETVVSTMDMQDENCLIPVVSSRRRSIKRKSVAGENPQAKVKAALSHRQPLSDVVKVNQSTECKKPPEFTKKVTDDDDIAESIRKSVPNEIIRKADGCSLSSDCNSQNRISVEEVAADEVEVYYEYLESIMIKELFVLLKRDVLDKVEPGTPKETIEWLVTEFLQSDDPVEPPVKKASQCTDVRKRRRSMTADREIAELGLSMASNATPSPPLTTDNRRRSRRLRKSLAVYREQGTLPTNISKSCDSDPIALDRRSLCDSEVRDDVLDGSCNEEKCSPDVSTLNADHVDNSEEFSTPVMQCELNNIDLDSALIIEDASLSETFTIESFTTPPSQCDDVVDKDGSLVECCKRMEQEEVTQSLLTPQIEMIYRNQNFVMPTPKPYNTIYEEPKKWKGDVLLFSKGASWRYYDFTEGCWYRVPQHKLNQRHRFARQNGYKAKTPNERARYEVLLEDALQRLDITMINSS